jgi:hypothetical protein
MSHDKSAVTGDLARKNVLSAIIKNQTSGKIHCSVEYRTLTGSDNDVIEFDINGNGEEQECEAKVHTASTNNPNSTSSSVFPKVIGSIQVQKSDGSQLQANAPFDNVPHEDVRNWKFTVEDDKIQSGEK